MGGRTLWNKVRLDVNTRTQLIGLRVVFLTIGLFMFWGTKNNIETGGMFFHSSFHEGGLYSSQILYEIIGNIVFLWFGTFGFKLKKSHNNKFKQIRNAWHFRFESALVFTAQCFRSVAALLTT